MQPARGGKRECDAVGRARTRTQFRIQVVLHLARRWLKHGSWDGAWGRISTGSTVLAKERTGPTAVRVRGKAKGREKEGAARVFGSLVSPLLDQGCLRACASRGRPGSDLPNGSGGEGWDRHGPRRGKDRSTRSSSPPPCMFYGRCKIDVSDIQCRKRRESDRLTYGRGQDRAVDRATLSVWGCIPDRGRDQSDRAINLAHSRSAWESLVRPGDAD